MSTYTYNRRQHQPGLKSRFHSHLSLLSVWSLHFYKIKTEFVKERCLFELRETPDRRDGAECNPAMPSSVLSCRSSVVPSSIPSTRPSATQSQSRLTEHSRDERAENLAWKYDKKTERPTQSGRRTGYWVGGRPLALAFCLAVWASQWEQQTEKKKRNRRGWPAKSKTTNIWELRAVSREGKRKITTPTTPKEWAVCSCSVCTSVGQAAAHLSETLK